MEIILRDATEDDLSDINAIYNHFVLNSTCTYQTEPSSLEERRQWFADHRVHGDRFPVLVALDAQTPHRILGWGSLSAFHRRAAYRFTAEDSVYVHHDFHRRAIGRRLLEALLVRAQLLAYHSVMALISADQPPSVELHRSLGFTDVGQLREVGFKFGRWLDVRYMQRLFAAEK